MFDVKQFTSAIKQISEEKGISESNVLETIEAAIAAAYKREYGKKGQVIRAKLDPETGKLEITQVHYVVEGVDEEEFVTGELPIKVMDDRHEEGEGRGRRRDEEPAQTEESGELKIKFNTENHNLL